MAECKICSLVHIHHIVTCSVQGKAGGRDLGWVDIDLGVPQPAQFCLGSWKFGRMGCELTELMEYQNLSRLNLGHDHDHLPNPVLVLPSACFCSGCHEIAR